jgi:hypothetical protein
MSIDFIADQLHDGRRFRALMAVDVFTREGDDMVRTLNQAEESRFVRRDSRKAG